jgi:hypothetical protein
MKCRENVESSFCELLKSFGEPSDWKTKTSFFLDRFSVIQEDRLHSTLLNSKLVSVVSKDLKGRQPEGKTAKEAFPQEDHPNSDRIQIFLKMMG